MSRRIDAYERLGRGDDDDFDLEDEDRGPARRRREEPAILLDEARFVVVSKPSGVPTVPERFRPDEPTIVDLVEAMLRAKDPAAPRPLVCHRLDRDTSGALVLAKDADAAKDLMAQFEDRQVEKSYLAICVGAPQPPAGDVTFRVDEDPRRKGAMTLVAKGGRVCESSYETLEPWRGVSLVRVRPRTGRTHQVRLTLLHLGTPCAIDPVYGSSEPMLLSTWKAGYRLGKGRREVPLIDRLTLHAEAIAFRRPGAAADDPSARVRVEAPMPKDLATAVRQLRRWGAPGTL
jgi:RluA family pseudouridine synthase